jgi:hypothetical protein
MTDVVLTLQLPRGNRFIPIAMCADPEVLRHFKESVLKTWQRELDFANDEIEAAVRRGELDKLHKTLDLLIPSPENADA